MKTKDIKVSIIVPVYNKGRTLPRCLDSLFAQTHTNLQIIVVNDASTDNSLHAAQSAAASDPRVSIIENPTNIGHYRSREEGVKFADGLAIGFCDADDTMEPRAIELMLDLMVEKQVDLVQMRYTRQMKGLQVNYYEQWNPSLAGRRIDGLDFRSLASYVGIDSFITPSCWAKLYRADLLKAIDLINFDQFWGEDQIFNIQYLRQARSIAFLDYVGYCYYWGGYTNSDYKFSQLREYKRVHQLKRLLGQSEQYIIAEITSLLRFHVRQMLTELSWTPTAVEKVMNEELQDPLWKQAGLEVSAKELVDQENENVQRSPFKYLVKKLLK